MLNFSEIAIETEFPVAVRDSRHDLLRSLWVDFADAPGT